MGASETKRCLDCGYILDHLPEPRCPECGRKFDPADAKTFALGARGLWATGALRTAKWLSTSPWSVVPLTWAGALLPICSPVLLVPLLGGTIANLSRRRWISTSAIVLLSPLAFFVYVAAWEYAAATGALEHFGPAPISCSIDPTYRCERHTGGCMEVDNAWVYEVPHNGMLKLLIRTLGPMRGSYTGPYPTKEDCVAALALGVNIRAVDLAADRVIVGSAALQLDQGVGAELLRHRPWESVLRSSLDETRLVQEMGPMRAATWQTCLILSIPDHQSPALPGEQCAMLVALDTKCGRPFAYYGAGGYVHRVPPVEWRR